MFRKIKEYILRKTERDAVRSEIHGEIVYLKRSRIPLIGDWGRIHPLVEEPIGNAEPTWNWENIWIGGKKNFFKLLFIMLIVGLVFYYVFSVLGDARKYMDGKTFVIVNKTIFERYCQTGTPIINYTMPKLNYTVGG